MRLSRAFGTILASVSVLVAGCASQEDVRLTRRPPMPPNAIVLAAHSGRFYRNISIEEVQGAPEFLFFDGGGLITTRPTRKQVLDAYTDDLDRTNLLAASRVSSDYMLYVKFEDLRGPDVWIGSDKRASARITFHLVRWRTGQVVKEQQIEVAYVAKSPGLTPREIAAGSVGLAAGVASGFAITRVYEGVDGVSAVAADAIGAGKGADVGIDVGEIVLLALNTGSTPRYENTPLSPNSEIGPSSGANRRSAATRGLLDLALDEFLHELSKDGSIVYKQGVSCLDLNPDGYRQSFVSETPNAYAVDCPEARYFSSKIFQVYPSNF